MNDFKQQATQLSPDIYRQFKTAIETGKWPDGRRLDEKQREIVLEAMIIYEHAHLPPEQHTGSIADSCKSASTNSADTQNLTVK